MIDFNRLLSLVDDMAAPNLPNSPTLRQEVLGRPKPRSGEAAPNLPNLPNPETEEDATCCEQVDDEACPPEECILTSPIKNNLGRLGNLGEPRTTNGYSCPTCHYDNLGSSENLGTIVKEEPWTCPLGHRAYWVSDFGLKICSTCHPKSKRRTP